MLTTDTNVALDLSPTSFGGESPVAIFGFFLIREQFFFLVLECLQYFKVKPHIITKAVFLLLTVDALRCVHL